MTAPAAPVWLLFCLLACLCGCQQGVFTPSSLPAMYQAPPPHSVNKVDLASLSNHDQRTDIIYRGDVLEVMIATGMEEETPSTWMVRVDSQDMARLPLVGGVQIGGRGLTAAEHAIRQACIERGIYRHPVVAIRLKQRQFNQVTVMGEVNEPGVYELPRRSSDLVAALAAAEGITEDADTIVEIRRPPPLTAHGGGSAGRPVHGQVSFETSAAHEKRPPPERVDLETAAESGVQQYLEDGAVVVVRKRPVHTIHVMGLVNEPDQFELPPDQDIRLLDALAMAGDRTLGVADKVRVIRQVPGRAEPVVISLSVRNAKRKQADNLRLAPGDLVSVEETPTTFVLEAMRSFIRFGFSSRVGM
jgi:polysaccharide export outer membrane protein